MMNEKRLAVLLTNTLQMVQEQNNFSWNELKSFMAKEIGMTKEEVSAVEHMYFKGDFEERNGGYTIIDKIEFEDGRAIVLGENEKSLSTYVTWYRDPQYSYHFGHYFGDKKVAMEDMLERGANEMRINLNHKWQNQFATDEIENGLDYYFNGDTTAALLKNEEFMERAKDAYWSMDRSDGQYKLADLLQEEIETMLTNGRLISPTLDKYLSNKELKVILEDDREITGVIYSEASVAKIDIVTNNENVIVEDFSNVKSIKLNGEPIYEKGNLQEFYVAKLVLENEKEQVVKEYAGLKLLDLKLQVMGECLPVVCQENGLVGEYSMNLYIDKHSYDGTEYMDADEKTTITVDKNYKPSFDPSFFALDDEIVSLEDVMVDAADRSSISKLEINFEDYVMDNLGSEEMIR